MNENTNQIVNGIISKAQKEGRTLLTEVEAKTIFNNVGIKTVDTRLATTSEEAVNISNQLGYPVVIKIVSPDITHKSDVGGVKLDLKNPVEVAEAHQSIMTAVNARFPAARIDGVSVQNMAKPGIEIVVGMTKDPQFGPVLMFGLGGILVEILKDVSFKVVPLTQRDAREMIREIKGYKLLNGYRGQEPVNIANLEDILLRLSDFCEKTPEIKEIDLNPILARADSAIAVDARIILE
jgi:acetate---CoA ligase (ADP-forming) subunit beta